MLFFACDISAMRGNTDKGVKYTKFSVRVVGSKAKKASPFSGETSLARLI